MSGNQTDSGTDAVTAALANVHQMLEADGYHLSWETGASGVVVNIAATPDACEDCLAPKQVLESILAKALEPTGMELETITLPTD